MSARIFRIGRALTGLGLFAIRPIKRGAYIATYRGRRVTTEEADRREARGARYLFTLNKRWAIDGSPRWNVARYINHSCKPNAEALISGRRVWIWSRKNIKAGEEINYDYGKEYFEGIIEPLGCKCERCGVKSKTSRTNGKRNRS
ncbi:MAG TPA: SET domain-containing protein-lysine N-methyltransferase [Xanthobacteraceae bacterium]|nr:SET domain-containing protein-lysine N-methyltransferase [Xanthobacteraceae bacterium]